MKFYLDEDSAQHRLVEALRSHRLDFVSCLDVGMRVRDDEAQLSFASAQGRVLVSGNAGDFAALHQAWMERDQSHAGILILPQQRYPIGEVVRRFLRVLSSRLDLANGIYYLSSF